MLHISFFYILLCFGKICILSAFFKFLSGLWREAVIGILLIYAVFAYPFDIKNMIVSCIVKMVYLVSAYLAGLFLTGEYKVLLRVLFQCKKG